MQQMSNRDTSTIARFGTYTSTARNIFMVRIYTVVIIALHTCQATRLPPDELHIFLVSLWHFFKIHTLLLPLL
jgi:hypothetical protein